MGKGDRRTRRGKIYRGTFGKRRQKRKKDKAVEINKVKEEPKNKKGVKKKTSEKS